MLFQIQLELAVCIYWWKQNSWGQTFWVSLKHILLFRFLQNKWNKGMTFFIQCGERYPGQKGKIFSFIVLSKLCNGVQQKAVKVIKLRLGISLVPTDIQCRLGLANSDTLCQRFNWPKSLLKAFFSLTWTQIIQRGIWLKLKLPLGGGRGSMRKSHDFYLSRHQEPEGLHMQ